MTVTIVAAVARNGVIGRDGSIPWRVPGEQRSFKEATLGHVVVMGRRTYESIGRPLPGRTTVVVTRQHDWASAVGLPHGVRVAGSLPAALATAQTIDQQIFLVGGAAVYAEGLAVAERLRISWVDATPEGDTFFPEVDWSRWREVAHEEHDGWALSTYERQIDDFLSPGPSDAI